MTAATCSTCDYFNQLCRTEPLRPCLSPAHKRIRLVHAADTCDHHMVDVNSQLADGDSCKHDTLPADKELRRLVLDMIAASERGSPDYLRIISLRLFSREKWDRMADLAGPLVADEEVDEVSQAPPGPFERFFSQLTPIAELADDDQHRAHLLAAYQLGFTLGRELAG